MTDLVPLRLPIRVLVKGASTVVAMSEWGYPRSAFTFPRALEAALLAAGRPAEVRSTAVASELTRDAIKRWEREILAWSPDVVIVVYGHYESIHYMLPHWLERHANSLRRRPGIVREAYRRRVLRPLWVSLAKLQALADRRFRSTVRGRHHRAAADLRRYIERAQSVGHPLVLALELIPPGARAELWFPGIAERLVAMNEAIADMVSELADPDVRVFSVAELANAAARPSEGAVPDGFHYSAPVHEAIGRALSAEVLAWAATQPHLQCVPVRTPPGITPPA